MPFPIDPVGGLLEAAVKLDEGRNGVAASPCPASRRPSLQLMSMAVLKVSIPVLASFWMDSKRLASSGVFLI